MSIVNWEKANEQSSHFKNTSPTKWAFTKEFLDKDLYQELYDTYPKFDTLVGILLITKKNYLIGNSGKETMVDIIKMVLLENSI